MACSVQDRLKKARQVNSKVKSMIIIFFDIKGIVRKEFILVGQTVNSASCCEVLRQLHENVQRLCPELWRQKNWMLLHSDTMSHLPPPQEKFGPKKDECHPPPTLLLSVLPIEDKTERLPF
jgi:hypothetical protein